jgi:hypothetical protein
MSAQFPRVVASVGVLGAALAQLWVHHGFELVELGMVAWLSLFLVSAHVAVPRSVDEPARVVAELWCEGLIGLVAVGWLIASAFDAVTVTLVPPAADFGARSVLAPTVLAVSLGVATALRRRITRTTTPEWQGRVYAEYATTWALIGVTVIGTASVIARTH